MMGVWSELRLVSTSVVDVYVVWFRVFMKKPSIKLVCV